MSRTAFITILLLAASAIAPAQAAIRYVAEAGADTSDCSVEAAPCATIVHAVGQADPGDTISIAPGTYTESGGIAISETLQLQGAGENNTIIQAHADSGMATNRVITIDGASAVAIADVTIRHGVAGPPGLEVGGGLISQDAALTLSRVEFTGNNAGDIGGGAAIGGGTATLTDVTFAGNHAGTQGGGMYSGGNAPQLTNVTFDGNSAGNSGGGMYSFGSSPILTGVVFNANQATVQGGGMYSQGGSLNLTQGIFTGNNAGFGGGMYNNTVTAEVTDTTFTGNTAANGAGMNNNDSSPTLSNVTFSANIAATSGGGIYNNSGSSPLLTNVAFTDNNAENGGGMYNLAGSPQLTQVTFSGNTATTGLGGGAYNGGGSPTFADVTFTANSADCGGGMFNIAGAMPTLTDVDFIENVAVGGSGGGGGVCSSSIAEHGGGGGMFNLGSSPALSHVTFTGNSTTQDRNGGGMYNLQSTTTLAHVTFTGNSVNGSDLITSGGGLYNSDSSATLEDVQFIANESSGSGGGMTNRSGSTTTLVDVTFSGNIAGGDSASGGGMLNQASATSLTNVAFSDNTADSDGGGLSIRGAGEVMLTDVTFLDNDATFRGGGMAISEGGATLANVVFARNAVESSPGGQGGGLNVGSDASATLVNAVLHENLAGNGGGLNIHPGGSATLINATLWGNTATHASGGGLNNMGGSIDLFSSIIWGNAAANNGNEMHCSGGGAGGTTLHYSLYDEEPGDVTGEGCFAAEFSLTGDPLFAGAATGDFHLLENSPAVNAGDPATDLDVFPTNGNGDPADIEGNLRLIGSAVDIGAFESGFDTPTQPVLLFEPTALDFHEVGMGVPSLPRSAVLRNNGSGDATQLAIDVSGSAFAVDASACGDTLVRGATCEVTIIFTPPVIGDFIEQLTISSTEGASALLNLGGTGIELPPQIDTDPDTVAVAVPQGETGIQPLAILNLGQQTLDWTIVTADPSKALPAGVVVDCEAEPGLVGHDDGSIEFGFPSFAPGIMLVDHFVPASYPAALSAACLALMTTGTTSLGFEIVVLADDGPGGQPGTELGALAFSAEDIPPFTPPPPPGMEPAWSSYDLSPLGLSIESGGVYVGVRWTVPDDSVFLAIDTSPPNPPGFAGGHAFGFQPGAWLPLTAVFPDYRSLFVRVVANTGSACDATTSVDWLDIEPAAGSTPGGASSEVALRFDTHDLAPGDYETLLCIASNDPANPATTVPISLTVTEPVPRSVTVLGGDGQTAIVGTPFANALAVQVRDGVDRPIAGVAVDFAAPASGASATLSATSVVTDAEGYAAVDATANAEVGDYAVTASVDGVAVAAEFQLGNRAAVTDVGVTIDSGRMYVQPGEMLDYVVSLANGGPDAVAGASVASVLAPGLDLDFATWQCLGPPASGCTESGTGDLADSNLGIAPGGAVHYLLSAPLRLDADGSVESAVEVAAPGDTNPLNDSASSRSEVVVYRSGFEAYGDGASGLSPVPGLDPWSGTPIVATWSAPGVALVESILVARSLDGGYGFRVERLNIEPANRLRLVATDEQGREHASAWLTVSHGGEATLAVVEAAAAGGVPERGVLLVLPAAELYLPLAGDASAYRLWSAGPLHRADDIR